MDVNAQTGVPAHQNMEHARSMQRDRVSRETCRRLQSHSIAAHTYVSLMTGEGASANWYGGRLSGYGPAQPDTRRFSSRAVIPGVGVLPASKRRPHRSVLDETGSCHSGPGAGPGALIAVPIGRIASGR